MEGCQIKCCVFGHLNGWLNLQSVFVVHENTIWCILAEIFKGLAAEC